MSSTAGSTTVNTLRGSASHALPRSPERPASDEPPRQDPPTAGRSMPPPRGDHDEGPACLAVRRSRRANSGVSTSTGATTVIDTLLVLASAIATGEHHRRPAAAAVPPPTGGHRGNAEHHHERFEKRVPVFSGSPEQTYASWAPTRRCALRAGHQDAADQSVAAADGRGPAGFGPDRVRNPAPGMPGRRPPPWTDEDAAGGPSPTDAESSDLARITGDSLPAASGRHPRGPGALRDSQRGTSPAARARGRRRRRSRRRWRRRSWVSTH